MGQLAAQGVVADAQGWGGDVIPEGQAGYMNTPTIEEGHKIIPNDEELPVILDKVYPCHEIVKIDYFLPGCPPSGDAIWAALTALLEGKEPALPYDLLKFD